MQTNSSYLAVAWCGELIGTERFYLKVGGLLYKRGADVGLRPDGLVVKSDAEKIEAERILSENIPSEHSHKRKVINPSLGELVACMGQIDEFRNVRAQFMTQRLEEGATMQQAEQESKEIETVYKKVNSKLQKLEASRQKLTRAIEKHEKAIEVQQQTSKETLSLQNSLSEDSLQEVQIALLEYKHELEQAKLEVQDKSLLRDCSEAAKKYLIEAGTEFCKFADSAIGLMNTVGYVAGEAVIPGGWAAVEAYDSGASIGESVEAQRKAAGEEFAVAQALGAGGAAGYIGYKLNKCYKALRAMPVLKPNFVSKLYSRMITRKLPNAEKQVAKEMEILFNRYKWTDPKTGLTRNVYVGNEFDPRFVDPKTGMSNLERMRQNMVPIGYDGKLMNQHHVMQNADGSLVFLSKTAHTRYSKLLHSRYGYGNKNPEYPVDHRGGDWTRTRQSINQFIAEILENGK